MASGTYSQIYIQIIFAVKSREGLIRNSWEEELYKYISGIVTNKDQKMIAINGIPNHIHILIGMRRSCRLFDLVREVKKSSSIFILEKGLVTKFNWQGGYGVFSYSRRDLDGVIKYIQNQKEHHKTRTFKEEYKSFLEEFHVEHKDEYLFNWIED